MSILLKPDLAGSDAILITTAASVAVCRGIREVLGICPQIKWVNDVYWENRKICGILTEAVSDFEVGKIDTVVVGIGINYKTEDFPRIWRNGPAVWRKIPVCPETALAAAVINEFWEIYSHLTDRTFMKEYREYSNVIGREISFWKRMCGEKGWH